MTSPRRRLAALVIAPLLVVGLAACAGAEPEALPTPTPTPTPTVEAPPEAKPGSRVPLSCDELAAVPSEFADVSVTAVDRSIDFVLAGLTDCELAATMDGSPVQLYLAIIPEVVDSRLTFLTVADPYEPSTVGFAGPRSGAGCQASDGEAIFCESIAVSQEYTIVVNLSPESSAVPAEPAISALASYQSGLIPVLDATGEPLPAWEAGPGVLQYPGDCDTEMGTVDQHIIDALPFETASAEFPGSGDGAPIYREAERRAGSSWCMWSGSFASGSSGSVTLSVLPGAAFAIDDGRFTPRGSEIVVSGADRAWQEVDEYGTYIVTVVVDRSIATVYYSPDYRGVDPDPSASILAVVAAVIASGPRV